MSKDLSRNHSKGKLNLVSVGPGAAAQITGAALAAVDESSVIVAYELYLNWIKERLPGKEVITTPLSQERERVLLAIEAARSGAVTSLISSGDIGIYAMATLAFELMHEDDCFDVQVYPGVTAALAGAAILGAPLAHDFATLSLSDLMCPWQWIEERARHIAAADLCLAMYNVQSKKRQEGVYRILDIMAEHKRPDTLCGIVRNAFREDGQSHEIVTLDELRRRKFDMFTTIFIGNRHTKKRREWIFTPRGYGAWDNELDECQSISLDPGDLSDSSSKSVDSDQLPDRAVWVFSGTQDGNALAAMLNQKMATIISTATNYGGELARRAVSGAAVISGRLGREVRRGLLASKQARAIVDATHPYADKMSLQLMDLAQELGLPYLRLERPASFDRGEAEITYCHDFGDALRLAASKGKRIFLSTGVKELGRVQEIEADVLWFARVTADLESVEKAVAAGIPQSRLCAMQGPFTRSFNEALLRQWQIDCLVTKDSGAAGGVDEKVEAASALGIPVIILARPLIQYAPACLFATQETLVRRLEDLLLEAKVR